MSQETLARAWEILQDAYQAQMEGDYERAVELYESSIAMHPTAEAHTFLGWTYHYQGKLDRAIAECKRADRKSTRLNSSHGYISYAVFCLKKKTRPMQRLRSSVRAARAWLRA